MIIMGNIDQRRKAKLSRQRYLLTLRHGGTTSAPSSRGSLRIGARRRGGRFRRSLSFVVRWKWPR